MLLCAVSIWGALQPQSRVLVRVKPYQTTAAMAFVATSTAPALILLGDPIQTPRDSLVGHTPAVLITELQRGDVVLRAQSDDQWIAVELETPNTHSVISAAAPRVTLRLRDGQVEAIGGKR